MDFAAQAITNAQNLAAKYKNELEQERQENWYLTQTLKFYADADAWKPRGHSQMDSDTIPAHRDKGERARSVLSVESDTK